jgi:AcrR family transcriptional regulator
VERDTRERILDAAALIIRRDGLARATTRQIAQAANCSEALLYKYFPDKQEIFLRVLSERVARVASAAELVGTKTVAANLQLLVEQLLAFYFQSFPMAASIFSNTELLTAHRQAMAARGAGPATPVTLVASYLDAEKQAGRLDSSIDTDAVARLLTGAALHEAFLANYGGHDQLHEPSRLAARLVRGVLPSARGRGSPPRPAARGPSRRKEPR